jgi:small subunit ribosomal protein S17e
MLYGVAMGRIRTKLIKKMASELVIRYPDKFSKNFMQNKQLLDNLDILDNKLMRNKVAGYIVVIEKKKS